MELSFSQFAFILLTIGSVMGIGLYAARSVTSSAGYSLAGRSAGAPLVAGSIAGTCIGGGATVGTAQLASTIGLSAWWFTLGSGISLLLMGLFYAKPLRRTALETIPQYIVLNYGKSAGRFTSLFSSLGILFSGVASTLPAIGIISALLHVSSWTAASILLILVACYSFFGGMKTAGVGGILKMTILFGSLFIAGISAFHAIQTDPKIAQALPDAWFSLFSCGVPGAMANLFSLVVGMICTQTYIQALFSASDPKTAAAGAFLAALITIPVGLPCAMIGMYMYATHPEISPLLVLPAFLLGHESSLIGGIAMGGIILSLIGSISGLSLGIATMLARDIFSKLLRITSDAGSLHLTRILVLAVIFCASAIAILNEGSQVLFWNYLSMALRGGGIFLPFTLAVIRPQSADPDWTFASMVLSTAAAFAAALFDAPVHPLFVGLFVSLIILTIGYMKRAPRKKLH